MNDNLTVNTIGFNLSYKDKAESKRQSNTRGINTPDVMFIRTQDYTDSVTKVPGSRRQVRIERHSIDTNDRKIITSATLVLAVPESATSTDTDALLATVRDFVADTDPNYLAAVLNDER